MQVSLKSVKVCKAASEETVCFTAEIVIDGAVAAAVSNDGKGSAHIYRFIERAQQRAFDAFCQAQPALKTEVGDLEMDADLYINQLLEAHEEERQLRSWCKRATIFRLPGDGKDAYRKLNRAYSPAEKAWVLANFPGAEILNERFV